MLAEERKKRQRELERVVRELSYKPLDSEEISGKAMELLEIYKDDFRHGYSSFFPMILDIAQKDDEGSLEYLSNNIETLRSSVEAESVRGEKEFESLHDRLEKLSDHLNLEIGRWSYYAQNELKIQDLGEQMGSATKDLDKATISLGQASKQASSLQTELITVLSIFAAIVITLSGGFTFLGSVMSSISNVVYIESVVLIAIICGMAIFNTIFLMMYLVGKITEKDIYARCLTDNCTCDEQQGRCSGIRRIRKRLPYVFYFNAMAIVGIIVNGIIWIIDINCKYF